MSESAVETEALPRTRLSRTFSALRYREFRLVWIGAFTSTTGTWTLRADLAPGESCDDALRTVASRLTFRVGFGCGE